MEAMVPKLLILQNFRRRISTFGTPPDLDRKAVVLIGVVGVGVAMP